MAFLAALTAAPLALGAVVPAQADAWTTDRFPTRNHGTDSVLRANSTPVKRVFVRFEVSSPGGAVQQAFLRVFAKSGAPQGFRVYATSPAWTEDAITHNSDGTLIVDSKWRTGKPADRTELLASGAVGVCTFGSPPCGIPAGQATNVVIIGNYCDPWPYEDEP